MEYANKDTFYYNYTQFNMYIRCYTRILYYADLYNLTFKILLDYGGKPRYYAPTHGTSNVNNPVFCLILK